jgi:hypothetical protein
VEVIQVALQQGLLVWIDDHLALTPSGLLLADQVILDLL